MYRNPVTKSLVSSQLKKQQQKSTGIIHQLLLPSLYLKINLVPVDICSSVIAIQLTYPTLHVAMPNSFKARRSVYSFVRLMMTART